ncbi:DUF775 domain-containing protein [Beauveria bassiana ARSEF 2860]|uniref:DUF775 domain-containing protein n=1 Tax=Beauveria bassiana (strain ARSEF 2860) TaxID=655819 RepID=J4UQU5_BEAB2|nr:DUF775 domain-containing protein [Beauveria bassiana ARSEF 2860]EJP67742.1 DUF775 domain-containing protein [Beauveria bassiana ARSEF 2860]
MSGPLFGLIPAGLPLITDPSSTPSPTSLLYALPSHRAFSHLVLFLLPGVSLPPGTAAAIYLATAAQVAAAENSGALPPFKFLGAIGPGKESAMFKVGNTNSNTSGGDASEAAAHHSLVIGVSIEAEADVAQKMQELVANKNASSSGSTQQQPSTVVLAQRIIQNAFNFLTGFSGTAGPGGVEVVPLKAFEEWWRKFENRVRNDPSFLEKQSD